MNTVFIGLGSNLGQSEDIISAALSYLSHQNLAKVVKKSALYQSTPLENKVQPDYINAVACLTGDFMPLSLLDELQAVEDYFGRKRNGERWASRTLDLDILLFDQQQIDHPRLQVPHAGMLQRDFVLYPLLEIAPEIEIPGFGAITKAIALCEDRGLKKIHEYHSKT